MTHHRVSQAAREDMCVREEIVSAIHNALPMLDAQAVHRAAEAVLRSQPFAAFEAEIREECAKVADREAEGRRVQMGNANAMKDRKAARDYESMAIAAVHIATAIRASEGERGDA